MLNIRCLHKSHSSLRNDRQVASDSHNEQRRIFKHLWPPNLKFKTAQVSSEESCFPSKVVSKSGECLPWHVNSDEPMAHLLPQSPEAKSMLNPNTAFGPSGAQILAPARTGLPQEAVCRCYLLTVLGMGGGSGAGEAENIRCLLEEGKP